MPDVSLPAFYRDASFANVSAEPFNTQRATVAWACGAAVLRNGWDGPFYEELDMTAAAVDLARLNAGAPLLDSHLAASLSNVIGRVEKAWLENGEARATVVFSERAEVQPLVADIRAGIIRGVSVGYRIHDLEATGTRDGVPVYRATRWEPMEISFVAIAADPGAGMRASNPMFPCQLREVTAMGDPTLETAGGAPVQERATPAVQTPAADPAPVLAAERKRIAEITALARKADCGNDLITLLIQDGASVDAARQTILDDLITRRAATPAPRPAHIDVTRDTGPADHAAAVIEALSARALAANGVRVDKPQGLAAEYAGNSLLGALARLAEVRGMTLPRFPQAATLYHALFAERSSTTSDFPSLLVNVMNKSLAPAYEQANPSYRMIARRVSYADLREHYFVTLGDFPTLAAKNQAGEYTFGAISDKHETSALTNYGRIVRLTRDVLINDDLAALGGLATMAGRRAADFENATFWTMFTSAAGAGPTLKETTRAVFNTTDKTLSSSSDAIAVTSLGAAHAAVMGHTTQDGIKLNIAPRYLVVSPTKWYIAKQFSAPLPGVEDATKQNPYAGMFEVVTDANLTGNPWYLLPDKSVSPFVYGYLSAAPGPQFATREGFTTDGVDFRLTLDFAAAALDYRGVWRNPGA
jgi:phage head maturation protease